MNLTTPTQIELKASTPVDTDDVIRKFAKQMSEQLDEYIMETLITLGKQHDNTPKSN